MKDTFFFIITLIAIFIGYTIVFTIAEYYFAAFGVFGFGNTLGDDFWNHFLKPVLTALFSILGILSKFLVDHIQKVESDNFSFVKALRKSITSKEFITTLIICPLVLLLIYEKLGKINDIVILFMTSYQNGFFWNSLLNYKNDEKKD